MSLCILHANCQGGPLRRLLLASAEFSKRWNILHITSYDRTPVPADALEHCELFLYQHLGPQWGDLASENLLARLPDNAKSIRLPCLHELLAVLDQRQSHAFWRYLSGLSDR